MLRWVKNIADNRTQGSWATAFRRKRMECFKRLIGDLPLPLRILDVGGTEIFWERMGFAGDRHFRIVLLNLEAVPVHYDNLESVSGDARSMPQFKSGEFDVVFSNSVIEHVGGASDKMKMAAEIQRLAPRYFIQTPNKYFPVEPHFLFPFFQFLPLSVRVFLLRHFDLGWHRRETDPQKAKEVALSAQLLTRKELAGLFPGGTIREERLCGLVKSFMVYDGFGPAQNKRSSGPRP